MNPPLLEMVNISKRFGSVPVLRSVSFSLAAAEIVCLLGENGAGKSTLMKILAGAYSDYGGTLRIDGKPVRFRNTRDAAAHGIGIVFQEFNLCPNLSAMENLFLGNEIRNKMGLIDYPQMRKRAVQAFASLGAQIAPDALVRDLGVAQQQMIEIAKALAHDTRLLVMDEPTAALPEAEVERLFLLMNDLKRRGISIIFISHKLNEVLRITDRVVCLKDGANSGEVNTRDVTEDRLISMMVGRDLDRMYSKRNGQAGSQIVLEVRDMNGPPRLRDISFKIHRGEVVGLAGLAGAGRTELAMLLIGAVKKTSGHILLHGKGASIRNPVDAVAHHIGYVPEDRKKLGLVLPMTVRENTTMAIHRQIRSRWGLISPSKENQVTDDFAAKLQMKISSREQTVGSLSGGNQQKVVLAKWLAIKPDLLILDEPTRGIDVGAKAEVHRIISALADEGVSILMISSELPEILHLCDRILVLQEGRLTGNIPREQANEQILMKAAVSGFSSVAP